MRASMVVPNVACGARSTLGLMRKRWGSGRSRSSAATLGMRPCCLSCSTRFLPARRSPASLPSLTVCRQIVAGQRTEPTTRASVTMPLPNEVLPPPFDPAGMRNPGRLSLQVQSRVTRHCGHRNTSAARSGDPSRQHPWDAPAGQWMERIAPPKPRRDKDALCQIAGSAPHGPGLRPPGRRVQGSCGCAERLHRARHPRHEGRGISLPGDRASPAISRFVQQSPLM
jgi:hypothetical protein